jgi:hypothetical protein
MPGKMTNSILRPPFRPPQVPAAVRSSRLSCGKVGKAQIFTSARESPGESRFKRIALRCEKTAQNYGSFVALALGFILIKSVHTA